MSFQPLVPLGGYAGWRFLSASLDAQLARQAEAPAQARDRDYFKSRIGQITDAADLVSDFRLLRTALGAFGLENDLPNRAFIRTILADDVTNDRALVNRLADKRYLAFAQAFGFGGPLPPKTIQPGFADRILARSDRQEFERAVGAQNSDMRLALTAQRELTDIANRGFNDTTGWLTVLGNPPLRKVFETALGLPASIGTLELDQQLRSFQRGTERLLGSSEFAQFTDTDQIEGLIRAFTLRSELVAGPSPLTPGYGALLLLREA